MVIMQDVLPGVKRFLNAAGFGEATERHVTGFIVAFIMHVGRMSATAASSAIRIHPRHRAQAMRFLARDRRTRDLAVLMQLADMLLAFEHRRAGQWLHQHVDRCPDIKAGRIQRGLDRAKRPGAL